MIYNKYLLYYMFSVHKNNDIKIKCEIDEKINLCFRCINCGFKTIETINKEKQLKRFKRFFVV